jgi:hypothetical protein
MEAAVKTMVGGGKGRMLCLFGNRCATNKQHMPKNQILLNSIPENSVEHSSLNSRIWSFRQNNKTPGCKK